MLNSCRKCGVERNEDTFYITSWTNLCKVCCRDEDKIRRDSNREKHNERSRLNRLKENKEKIKKYQSDYRANNKEKIKKYSREWRAKNKEKIREDKRLYVNKKRAEDPLYKLTSNVRCLIKNTFLSKGLKKANKTEEILGCTIEFFIDYISAQFKDEMSVENYGSCKDESCTRYWELDHIYPVSKAISEEHLIQLNHYTNFRPLWYEDNRNKHNKIEEVQLRLL